MNKGLLTPDRDPTIDHSKDITKAQLGKPMSFLGLLTGVEMSQRQLHH